MMYWLWAINWGRVGYSMNGGTESGEPFVTGDNSGQEGVISEIKKFLSFILEKS